MMRCFLVEHITRRPHRALRGMTYDDMSSKLNRVRFEEERFTGDSKFREFGRRLSTGERIEELEPLDVRPDASISASPEGVPCAGELEDDNEVELAFPPEYKTAMRPSGTWYTIFGPCLRSKTA